MMQVKNNEMIHSSDFIREFKKNWCTVTEDSEAMWYLEIYIFNECRGKKGSLVKYVQVENRLYGIKQTLDDLGTELLNNVVVKYNTNLSKIRNINKSNLNSDYVKLFFAVITSYNEKVDFFKIYDKIKEYKGF